MTLDGTSQEEHNFTYILFCPRMQAAAAAVSLQSCPTLCDPTDGSPWGSAVRRILQGKNTGVGCHFLLQCMTMKSESEVAQSYLTLSDPMDCSLPGSSIHGIFQTRVLEWAAICLFGQCQLQCLEHAQAFLGLLWCDILEEYGFFIFKKNVSRVGFDWVSSLLNSGYTFSVESHQQISVQRWWF